MEPAGFVEATERLYRLLFGAACAYMVATIAWGVVIAPFNSFNDHQTRSLALGAGLFALAASAWPARPRLFYFVRRHPSLLLVVATVAVGVLWADGGWRSSFYLASYSAGTR